MSGDRARISTAVFIEGRVVAKREVALDPVASEDDIKDQLNRHHTMVVDNLLSRATALSAEKQAAKKPFRQPVRPSTLSSQRQPATRPEPGDGPKVERSLQVRRLLARFRKFIVDVRTPSTVEGFQERLRATLEVVTAIMANPVFEGVRLDEQVRFFDVKDRIPDLLEATAEVEAMSRLWAEVITFAGYLGAINQRQELVEFDRQMLNWALDALGGSGDQDEEEILEHLAWCYGLDFELDRLLDAPEGVPVSVWRERMFGLLDHLGRPDW